MTWITPGAGGGRDAPAQDPTPSRRSAGPMSLSIGLTGLTQSGKSTLFQSLTSISRSDPSGKRLPLARVPVPDERLWKLAAIFKPKKTTPATVDFLDMPGGGSAGLGSAALAEIRTSTVLVEVVRCFGHPYLEGVHPRADMESFETELLLADLKVIEGKLERTKKMDPKEKALLESLQAPLGDGDVNGLPSLDEEQRKLLSGLGLLCLKPRLAVANIPEADLGGDSAGFQEVKDFAASRQMPALAICAEVEAQIAELPEEDRADFMQELGIASSGLEQLIHQCYARLGLQTFFTTGEDECRAWTTRVGAHAPEAAGEIHTDLQRGFIRAEVIDYPTFMECGSMHVAKEKGLLRVEGKEYVVRDGDMLNIRFNV